MPRSRAHLAPKRRRSAPANGGRHTGRRYPDGSRVTQAYDPAGNRTRVVESATDVVTWSYDATYQLTRERRSGTTAFDVTYGYDPAGNRLLRVEGAARTTSAYDAASQLTVANAGATRTTFAFDGGGNMGRRAAGAAIVTYAWDPENQLTRIQSGATTLVTNAYSGDFQRRTRDDASGATKFVWDRQNLLAETDGAGATQAEYTQTAETFGQLVSQRRGGATSTGLFDAIGSTSKLIDASQAATDGYLYGAFGDVRARTGTTVNPHEYVGGLGYFRESGVGLTYIRRRWYDSFLGAFLSADPFALQGVQSLYSYAQRHPLKIVDPSGLRDVITDWKPDEARCELKAIVDVAYVNADDIPDQTFDLYKQKFKSDVEKCWRSKNDGIALFPFNSVYWLSTYHLGRKCHTRIHVCPCFDEGWNAILELNEVNSVFGNEELEIHIHAPGKRKRAVTSRPGDEDTKIYIQWDHIFSLGRQGGTVRPGVVDWPAGMPKSAAPGQYSANSACHEMGHALGLDHPGKGKGPWKIGDIEDYLWDAPSLMGLGSELRVEYFRAWEKELNRRYPYCIPHKAIKDHKKGWTKAQIDAERMKWYKPENRCRARDDIPVEFDPPTSPPNF